MSMELFVLSDRWLASIAEWQRAINAEGFPLRLSTETPFEELDGILAVQLGDKRTSFECVHWNARVLMAESPGLDFGHQWAHALSFRWGADHYATPAAYMAGAAYAKATDGIVLDCEEYKIFTPQRTVEVALQVMDETPAVEAALRRFKAELPDFIKRLKSEL